MRAVRHRFARLPRRARRAICGVNPCRGRRAARRAHRSRTAAVDNATESGQPAAAQFSLYVMGTGAHMDEIYGCIDFLKRSGTFRPRQEFLHQARCDAGAVFAALDEAFLRFGPGAATSPSI